MSTNVKLQAGLTYAEGDTVTSTKLNTMQTNAQTLINDIDGGTQLGAGTHVYKQKNGANLEYKSLTVSGDLTISNTATEVDIGYAPVFPMINIYSNVLVVSQSSLATYTGNWTVDSADSAFTGKYTLSTGEVEIPSTGRYMISVSQNVQNNFVTETQIGFSIGGTTYALGGENVIMKTADTDNLSTGEAHSLIRTLDFTAGDLIKPMGKCNATGATITVDLAEFSVRKVPS